MAGTDAHLSLAGGAPLTCGLSKCRNVGLRGANAPGLVDVEHKYLPVPDLPSLRGRSDGLDGVVDQLARHRYLDLDLRQEGHCVFGPPIELAMAPLWRPYPLTSVTVIPGTPIALRALRTCSSSNGLMMAMMI